MRTRICDLLGIELPIVQAGMSLFTAASPRRRAPC